MVLGILDLRGFSGQVEREKAPSFSPAQVECRRNRFCHSRDGGKFISFPVKIGRLREREGSRSRGRDGWFAQNTHTAAVGGNEVKQRGREGGEKEEGVAGRSLGWSIVARQARLPETIQFRRGKERSPVAVQKSPPKLTLSWHV